MSRPKRKLRVLIFGAGAIGTYIGVSLATAGHLVTFLERPEKIDRLQERGFQLALQDHVRQLPDPHLTADLSHSLQEKTFDLAVFALKSYHTRPILGKLRTVRNQLPPLLCLQNGVENEALLAEILGPENVIPGTVTSAVSREKTGWVRLEKERGIGLAGDHPLIKELAETFQAAGLSTSRYQRPEDMKWSKLLTNLLANASSAILNMTPEEIFRDQAAFDLEIRQQREALQVMKAAGIKVVNLPGVPVKLLARVEKHFPRFLAQPMLVRAVGGGRGEKMPSFHVDLYSGQKESEVDALNGAVVRAGRKYQVSTPVNQLMLSTLTDLIEGTIPREKYAGKPRRLRRALTQPSS